MVNRKKWIKGLSRKKLLTSFAFMSLNVLSFKPVPIPFLITQKEEHLGQFTYPLKPDKKRKISDQFDFLPTKSGMTAFSAGLSKTSIEKSNHGSFKSDVDHIPM